MGKEFLIVKNVTWEGPAMFEPILQERNIPYRVVDLSAGEGFPSLQDFGGLLVFGGPASANDGTDLMSMELARIQEALENDVPYLGVCLGLQTLVKAAGGRVVKNPVPEIGLRDPDGQLFTVELTEEGKRDPLLAGLDPTLNVFHLHGETVELTPGMTLLATGKFCRNQIVRVAPRAYGMQCHVDLTGEMFETWVKNNAELSRLGQALRDDFNSLQAIYPAVGRKLFKNFLSIAGLGV